MNNSIQDDIDLLLNSDDTDDEELRLEGLRDKITKESFLSMVENATVGADLLPIIELLPNSSQRYGHSITMNAIIKIIARHAVFKDHAAVFYTMKTINGKAKNTISTFNVLSNVNKGLVRTMIREITPDNGPWGELVALLRSCDVAFNESTAAIKRSGMPMNRIACVSHMLVDERFLACYIPLSNGTGSATRPSELDQIKATGRTKLDAVYEDIHKSYLVWMKDYENPFTEGPFSDELGAIRPNQAVFKDGDAIRALVRTTVQKVETFLSNHSKSGQHTSGDERLQEIKNSFITSKGKNIDVAYFYALLMLENKDLKFVSRSLDVGIGTSAGLGTIGGGATAVKNNRKRDNPDEVMQKLDVSVQRFLENSERFFSPPPYIDTMRSSDSGESDRMRLAKEAKIDAERKLLFMNNLMEHHKFVLTSDAYDASEKQVAKEKINDLVLEMEKNSK